MWNITFHSMSNTQFVENQYNFTCLDQIIIIQNLNMKLFNIIWTLQTSLYHVIHLQKCF